MKSMLSFRSPVGERAFLTGVPSNPDFGLLGWICARVGMRNLLLLQHRGSILPKLFIDLSS
jgi:hypothetical protein